MIYSHINEKKYDWRHVLRNKNNRHHRRHLKTTQQETPGVTKQTTFDYTNYTTDIPNSYPLNNKQKKYYMRHIRTTIVENYSTTENTQIIHNPTYIAMKQCNPTYLSLTQNKQLIFIFLNRPKQTPISTVPPLQNRNTHNPTFIQLH